MMIINLTPHAITLTNPAVTIPPCGTIARAGEWVQSADAITLEDGSTLPTSWVTYTRLEDLPLPEPGVCYVVSLVVAQAATATHRATADLLTPGEHVRDDKGRIIGCRSLARVGRGIPNFAYRDPAHREAFVAECLRQGGAGDVSAEREPGHLGRYARQYASAALARPATIAARDGDLATFYCSTRKGRGVHLTGVPFGTLVAMDDAYALLARAGARCNDASDAERATAVAAVASPDQA